MSYCYVSAENDLDLLWCPPDVWQARVPAAMRDMVPKVEIVDGAAPWTWEGRAWGPSASGNGSVVDASELDAAVFSRPGSETALGGELERPSAGALSPSTPGISLSHMDWAGIWVHVIYGPTRKQRFDDDALARACNRACDDFMLKTSAASPNRTRH